MTDLSSYTHVRVRDYPVLADIGINPDEVGRRQSLVVSVDKCLTMGDVVGAEISIDKPLAITRGMAGTRVKITRD